MQWISPQHRLAKLPANPAKLDQGAGIQPRQVRTSPRIGPRGAWMPRSARCRYTSRGTDALTLAVGCPFSWNPEKCHRRALCLTQPRKPGSCVEQLGCHAEWRKRTSGGVPAELSTGPSLSTRPGLTWGRWGAAPARHECTSCGTGARRAGQPRAPEPAPPRRWCSPPARRCRPA